MSSPPQHTPSAAALVRSTRREINWVSDEKLPELQYREIPVAMGLAAVTGGGGHLYTGDVSTGIKGIAAMAAAFIASAILPASISLAPILGVALWGAYGSWRRAKLINRYLLQQQSAVAEQTQTPKTQQLLSSMAHPSARGVVVVQTGSPAQPALLKAPGKHADLLSRLQKLSSIRASQVLSEDEFRSRKIDLLTDNAAGLDAAETESLLFALLPLLDSGALNEEDMQFVKELGT